MCGTDRSEGESYLGNRGSHQCYRVAKVSGTCQFQLTVEPLRKLTRQGGIEGKEENEAFEALKKQLAEASMLAFYDKDVPTTLLMHVQSDLGLYLCKKSKE